MCLFLLLLKIQKNSQKNGVFGVIVMEQMYEMKNGHKWWASDLKIVKKIDLSFM